MHVKDQLLILSKNENFIEGCLTVPYRIKGITKKNFYNLW